MSPHRKPHMDRKRWTENDPAADYAKYKVYSLSLTMTVPVNRQLSVTPLFMFWTPQRAFLLYQPALC